VGLKQIEVARGSTGAEAFNRTSVGLKREIRQFINFSHFTFNRTSVGLKHYQADANLHHDFLLLIEPVWD